MGKKARNRAKRVHWADEDEEINPESDACLPRRSGSIGFGDPSFVDQLKMDRPRLPTLNKLVSTESERVTSAMTSPTGSVNSTCKDAKVQKPGDKGYEKLSWTLG